LSTPTGFIKAVLFLLLPALFVGKPAQAELRLFDLSLSAQQVVLGTITRLENHHFIVSYVVGGKKKKLRIVKSIYPKSNPRYAPYTVGQQILAFVSYHNGDYRLLAPGAELPVIKDSVVIPMQFFTEKIQKSLLPAGSKRADYLARQSFKVAGKMVPGLRFKTSYLYRNIMEFRACYQIILKKDPVMAGSYCFNFFDRRTRDQLNVVKRRSKMIRLLYNDMEEAQIQNCKR